MRQRSETKKSCRKKKAQKWLRRAGLFFLAAAVGHRRRCNTANATYLQTNTKPNRTDAAFSPKQHWTACGEIVVKQQQTNNIQTHTVRRKGGGGKPVRRWRDAGKRWKREAELSHMSSQAVIFPPLKQCQSCQ